MKKAFLMFLLFKMFLISCSFGTVMPTATPVPTSTTEPPPTSTLPPPTSTTEPPPTNTPHPPTSTPLPTLEGGQWELVWHDEFDDQTLDTAKWEVVDNCDDQRNNEQQCYIASAVSVSNGSLVIAALEDAKGGFPYTSGAVKTGHKYTQAYGRFEFRAKLPIGGDGIWPALWLYSPDQWPPEIDVLEAVNDMSDVYMNYWWVTENEIQQQLGKTSIQNPSDWHVYAMEWEGTEIRWYIDDQLVHTIADPNITNVPMQVYMNIAIGGDWPNPVSETTIFPQYMYVDYVRLYK